jgi:hypothetical protein
VSWQSRDDERVARALEGAPQGRAGRGLAALAERIREVPAATGLDAAPDFRAALRARILADGATLLPRPRSPAEATETGQPAETAQPPQTGGRTGQTADDTQDLATLPTTADSPSAGGPGSPRPPRARNPKSPPGRPAGRRRRHRKTIAAAALVIATLSGTAVAASGDARPGDPLYGLKRKVQGVELIVARTDVDRGHRHLELARIRVRELSTAGPSAAPGPLLSTLDDMDSETRAGIRLLSTDAVDGTDEARLDELSAWTAQQRALLIAASARLPAAARARAAESLVLLATVAARLEQLRGTVGCENCGPAKAPDELGPNPCTTGCGPTPSSPPPVQTQTRPPTGPTAPPAVSAAPIWPPGPVGTVPAPGRPPSAPGTAPASTAGPSWPDPQQPPATMPSTSPEPPAEPEPSAGLTSEPTAPQAAPDLVTGVLDVLDGLLSLTR